MGTALERLRDRGFEGIPGFEDMDRLVERMFEEVGPVIPGIYHFAGMEMEEKDGVRTYRMRIPEGMAPTMEYEGGILRVKGNFAREVRGWRKNFPYEESFHVGALPNKPDKLETKVDNGYVTLRFNVSDLPKPRTIEASPTPPAP